MTDAVEEFEVRGSDGRPIRGDVRLVPGAKAAIVLCHGFKGFARWGFFPWLADRFVDAGFSTISFDFSGSGVGADRESFTEAEAFAEHTFTQELRDLAIVFREGAARGWLGRRRGLFGFSRGGGIAVLHAGSDETVGALVTWSAISTVERWTGPQLAEWRRRGFAEIVNSRTGQVLRVTTAIVDDIERNAAGELNIAAAAARVRAPWLIVHGDADETVAVYEARQLHADSSERAELVVVPGATHTYGGGHGMVSPTPQLEAATERTIEFFRASLV